MKHGVAAAKNMCGIPTGYDDTMGKCEFLWPARSLCIGDINSGDPVITEKTGAITRKALVEDGIAKSVLLWRHYRGGIYRPVPD